MFTAFHGTGNSTGSNGVPSRPALREQALAFAGKEALPRLSPPGRSAVFTATGRLRSALFIAFHGTGNSTGSNGVPSRPALHWQEFAFAGKEALPRRLLHERAAVFPTRAFALRIDYCVSWYRRFNRKRRRIVTPGPSRASVCGQGGPPRRSPPGKSAVFTAIGRLRSALFTAFRDTDDSTGSNGASSRPALRGQAFAGREALPRQSLHSMSEVSPSQAFAPNAQLLPHFALPRTLRKRISAQPGHAH